MKDLTKRTLTGIIFVIIVVACIKVSNYSFLALSLAIIILSMLEFYRIVKNIKIIPQRYYGIFIGIILFIIHYFTLIGYLDSRYYLILIPLIVSVFIYELFRDQRRPFSNIAYTILGVIYIALPVTLFCNFVFTIPEDGSKTLYNPNLLLGFFFLIWANDTASYIFGQAFGKRKLFRRVSNKKTWEGCLGGAVTTIFVAYLISSWLGVFMMHHWLIIGGIIVVMGTLSDLSESLFKRSVYIKDTGTLLPGHGGMLDRIDSVLLSAPFIYAYITLYQSIN